MSHAKQMDNPIKISKFEAARRQLRMAIRLLFEGADPVPIHTLIGASSIVLSDLIEKKVPDRSWDHFARQANNISASEYFRVMREAQNFLKHAKDDPDAMFDFDPTDTESLAFCAVMNSGELGPLSMEESVLQLWYIACHDPQLEDSQSPYKEALELFGDLRGAPRQQRLEAGRKVLVEQIA
jgi:hypothetical protein